MIPDSIMLAERSNTVSSTVSVVLYLGDSFTAFFYVRHRQLGVSSIVISLVLLHVLSDWTVSSLVHCRNYGLFSLLFCLIPLGFGHQLSISYNRQLPVRLCTVFATGQQRSRRL